MTTTDALNKLANVAEDATAEERRLAAAYLAGMKYCREHPNDQAAADTLQQLDAVIKTGGPDALATAKALTWQLETLTKERTH